MKDTLMVPPTEQSMLECMRESTMQYMIDYLLSGLESLERCPPDSDFQEGYEQALRDTIVDLLRCHVLQERTAAFEDQRPLIISRRARSAMAVEALISPAQSQSLH
jgi:hypothetical protein